MLTKKQSLEILEIAWNNNIKIFDTAPNYNSEKIIGDFVRTHSLEKEVIICTKISTISPLSDWEDSIKKSIDNSILELQCETIDVLFFHNPEDSRLLIKYPEKFIAILNEFPINKIGVSVYEESEIKDFNNFDSFDIAFQFPFNILDQRFKNNKIKKGFRYARSIFLQGVIISEKKLDNSFPIGLRTLHRTLHEYLQNQGVNPI